MRAVVCMFVAAIGLLTAGTASGGGTTFVYFRMPSNNFWCVYMKGGGVAPELRCDSRTPIRPLPPKPKSCQFDWGAGYAMGARGRAHVLCVSDSAYKNGSRVLRYGTRWHKDAFTCFSKRIGLRCVNASRHGFFLSKQHSYKF